LTPKLKIFDRRSYKVVSNFDKFIREIAPKGYVELVVSQEKKQILLYGLPWLIPVAEDKIDSIDSFNQASNETTRKFGYRFGINYNPKIDRIGGTIAVKAKWEKEVNFHIHYPKDKSGIKDVTITENTTLTHDFFKKTQNTISWGQWTKTKPLKF
jgi:hypothetical protein